MYHITERNERQGRQQALVLAVALHFALGAYLYVVASEKPAGSSANSAFNSTKTEKINTSPKPKTVQMP